MFRSSSVRLRLGQPGCRVQRGRSHQADDLDDLIADSFVGVMSVLESERNASALESGRKARRGILKGSYSGEGEGEGGVGG